MALVCATLLALPLAPGGAVEPQPYGRQTLIVTAQGRPAAYGLVNGRGPYLFLIDTGSSQTIFSEALVKTLGLSATAKGPVTATTASGAVSSLVYAAGDITTAGITIGGMEVLTASLPKGAGADGLLGSDFLSNLTVDLDMPGKSLALYPAGSVVKPRGFVTVAARADSHQFLVMPGRCRNSRCDVYLDTAGLISVGNEPLSRLLPPPTQPNLAIDFLKLNGLDALGIKAYPKQLTGLSLGRLRWSYRDIVIAGLPVFDKLDTPSRPALFLGLDLAGKRRIILDYKNATVTFQPAAAP
jgi:hypothetical protein